MRRKIIAFGKYYKDFLSALGEKEVLKVKYVLSLLETEDRMPVKFIKAIRDGLYELRISYNGNIYRIFFIFDEGQIVVLFNGFQKKTQKTPPSEIFDEEAYAFYTSQILLDARKEAGMTQSELADRLSVTKSYISRIEKGVITPSVATFYRIMHALGMRVEVVKPIV